MAKVCNVLLPFGFYLLVMGLWKNVGRTSLLLFPALFYGAFQVVLLFLYGESIIAVDMFLNVVTTNVEEATELLANLAPAVVTICLLYLPTLIWGICLCVKKNNLNTSQLRPARFLGSVIFAMGIVSLIICVLWVKPFNITRDIFPINVIRNTFIAAERTKASNKYHDTSAAFTYHAQSTRPVDEREVYVVVIGETSRAENWQLFGYDRPTNPKLSQRNGLLKFPRNLSESNTTHKSVPLMLTSLSAVNFGDSIYSTKSIITAFKEAGYRTAYLSNQGRNGSLIDFFAEEADTTAFITDTPGRHYDHELLPLFEDFLEHNNAGKLFVILHTYGSHFNYMDRYDEDSAYFSPDKNSLAEASNRPILLNAYDNTIRNTDSLLDSVIAHLEHENCRSGLMYVSDHGEDIFDDSRERFLHASPKPTYYQIHVPMILWASDSLSSEHPEMLANARKNEKNDVSGSVNLFHTMINLAGIRSPYYVSRYALTDSSFAPVERIYLNDYNEGVSLKESGLKRLDFELLKQKEISAN